MLVIKTADGAIYEFEDKDYTEYAITNEFVVVKKYERWIGVFDKRHFVSLLFLKEDKA